MNKATRKANQYWTLVLFCWGPRLSFTTLFFQLVGENRGMTDKKIGRTEGSDEASLWVFRLSSGTRNNLNYPRVNGVSLKC